MKKVLIAWIVLAAVTPDFLKTALTTGVDVSHGIVAGVIGGIALAAK